VPLSETTKAFTYLYKTDTSTVECVLCHDAVKSMRDHMADKHPTVRFDEYQQKFPGAPVEGKEVEGQRTMIEISEEEIAVHPCGRDGVLIEKAMAPSERPYFPRTVSR
jgi:hypothetical protein